MKTKILSILFLSITLILFSCEKENNNDNPTEETLYVKFTNSASSTYTISNIQLRARGASGVVDAEPAGDWGSNILESGKTIAPGAHEFFTLSIPNGDWSEYRLGVLDGNGNEIMLHEQVGFSSGFEPSITYWGANDRTTSVSIIFDNTSNLITINGFSDWIGID